MEAQNIMIGGKIDQEIVADRSLDAELGTFNLRNSYTLFALTGLHSESIVGNGLTCCSVMKKSFLSYYNHVLQLYKCTLSVCYDPSKPTVCVRILVADCT